MSKHLERGIDLLISGLMEIKEHFKTDNKPTHTFSSMSVPATPQLPKVEVEDDLDSFDKLKKALQSDRWPEAVNSNLICDPESETEKVQRGQGIIELMVEENLQGLKFLDFGCSEGHTTRYAADKGAFAVGYDIYRHADWQNRDNLKFASNFNDVEDNGPYDIILLFDVLDHARTEDPITLLKKAERVLAKDGKIYVRTHPFTSRHATHLYHDLNKAYVHLVFSPQELSQLVPTSKYAETSVGVTMPIATYTDWITKANLKIVNKKQVQETVEPFFKIPKIAERILKHTRAASFPEFQMSIQFIDFVLAKNAPVVPQPEPQESL